MSVSWDYFNQFSDISKKYMLSYGEGDTKASQIVTAVCKLIYKWYNDGDVFDNTAYLDGWVNDLSSYANWLYKHTPSKHILNTIYDCNNDSDYEDLLKELADKLFNEEYLIEQNQIAKVDTIYKCEGKFEFLEDKYNYDDDDYYDDEDYEIDEEDW